MNTKKELEKESDEQLLHLFANSKNREALDALFERHMVSAYHIAFKFMHNQADAEDVVQKAFINVMRFAGDQNQPGMVKAWIMKTVINTSKNEIKHLIRQRKLLQDKPIYQPNENPSFDEETGELRKILVSAIEQLPDHFRWPIWLTHFENLTIKEVSHVLGKSENTIRTQISRGIGKLEQSLKSHGSKVGGMNIVALLADCKSMDSVPPTLYAKIKTISNLKDSAKMYARVSAHKFNLVWIISPVILLLSSYFAFLWWQSNKGESSIDSEVVGEKPILKSADPIANIEPQKLFNLFWNFNSEKLPNWCSVKNGNFQILSDISKNDQCLKVLGKEDFLMDLAIPDTNRSFKVSYDAKIVPIANERFHIFSLTSITKKKGITFLFNYMIEKEKWNHVEVYVQKNIEAIYYNGILMMVVIYPLSDDNEFSIHLRGAIVFLDNIEVKSLKEKEYKDFSKCLALSKEFMQKEGYHLLKIPSPLPEVNSGNIEVYWGNDKDE